MATTTRQCQFTDINSLPVWETVPSLIPAVAEDLYTAGDVYLVEITLSNQSAAAVTVTISDRQASPLPIVPTVSLAPGQLYEVRFEGRLTPNGVSWVASDGAAIVGYLRWRVRPKGPVYA